ncbi:MAG TPA: hypothetical protein VGM05_25715 [Planctomycetaceae bacterium]|jgi:hypothetical protein
MSILRGWPLAVVVVAFATPLTICESRAEDQPRSGNSIPAAPRKAATVGTVPAPPTPAPPVRVASNGRYPAGQFLGGYRNPFGYHYYRYGPRRYPFGNGPYGPYDSNYGGYSGNRYAPGVNGRLLPRMLLDPAAPPDPQAPPDPDAPPALPIAPAPPGATIRAPLAVPVPPALAQPIPGGPVQAVPNANMGFGDPAPYVGNPMYNPSYGNGRFYGMHPFGFTNNPMWYGHNGHIPIFNAFPTHNYPYSYGPPSGAGFYSPEYAPEYSVTPFVPRNFGPAYPAVGGINGGSGW